MTFVEGLTWLTVLRLLNALLSTIVFGALIHSARINFRSYVMRYKLLHISFTLFALRGAYGSLEDIVVHSPGGFRIFITLAANLFALVGFTIYSTDENSLRLFRRNNGNDPAG